MSKAKIGKEFFPQKTGISTKVQYEKFTGTPRL
jgi:hypothetical protein